MKILALDLGKSKSAVCILDTDSVKERYTTITTVPFALMDLLEREHPDRVVFEVGTLAGWVHDVVVAQGCRVQVANPNHEGWRWRNVKRKTDRLDALKLVRLSAAEQLPTVYMPSPAVREHRALIQYRTQLVGRRTRIKNTIGSLIARQGCKMACGAAGWTQKEMGKLRQWALPWDQTGGQDLWCGQLHEELQSLEQIEQQLLRVERKLDRLGRGDERTMRLQTIPCVDPRTAEMLVAVLDDPHRFKSGKHVGGYVGLTPRQYQSGQTDRSGGISKQGHRQLRRMLIEASWLALRYNPPLRAVYERLCRGSVSRRKIAIVGLARRLLIIAWAMLRDGTTWRAPRLAAAWRSTTN
jgi:transposase